MDLFSLKNLMDNTDKTILRCVENGVAIPAEWVTYRSEIRALITAGGGTVPTQPPYPSGT